MANEPIPGHVAVEALKPQQFGTLDQTRYQALAPTQLARMVYDQARTGKTAIGMPESWYQLGFPDVDPRAALNSDGSITPLFDSMLTQWAASPQFAANTNDQQQIMMGVRMPTSSSGFVPTPLTPEQALAIRKQDFTEAQALAKAAASAVGGSAVRPPSASTLGQATSQSKLTQQLMEALRGTPVNTNVRQFDPETALQMQLAQGKLNLDNLIFEADKAYKQATLAQNQQQFQATLDYQKQRDTQQLGLERAATISKFAADPGDAVAREYFLRAQGQQPAGTPVDIFTGQAGSTPTTQAELAAAQAPLLAPYAQAAGSNSPVVPAPAPAPPLPGLAYGTEDGWTRAPKFIAGDPQVPGQVNPELIQLRIKDGEPQAKVTPISQLAGRTPMYADGTDSFFTPYTGTPIVVAPMSAPATAIGAGSLLTTPATTNGITSMATSVAPTSTYVVPKATTTAPPPVVPPAPVATTALAPAYVAPRVTTAPTVAPTTAVPPITAAAPLSSLSMLSGIGATVPPVLPGVNIMASQPALSKSNVLNIATGGLANQTEPLQVTVSPNDAYIAQRYGIDINALTSSNIEVRRRATNALASARVQAAIDGIPLPGDSPDVAARKAEAARAQAMQPLYTPEQLQQNADANFAMGLQLSAAAGGVQMIDPTKPGYITNEQYYRPTLPEGLRTAPDGSLATYAGPMASGVGTNEYQAGLRGPLQTPEPTPPGASSVNNLGPGGTSTGTTPPPPASTQTGSPGVMGGVAVSAPQAGGFRIVGQNGTYTTPDGGGTATVQVGDRIGPDGIPYRFNTATNSWGVAPVVGTKITSLQDFYTKVPAPTREKILSGQPTYYVLGDNRQNDWVASLLNPRQMTFPGTPDAMGAYPPGTLPPGQAPVQLNPANVPATPTAVGVTGEYGQSSAFPGVSGVAGSTGWKLQPDATIGMPPPAYAQTFLPAPGEGDRAYVDYVTGQARAWQAEDARAAEQARIQREIVENQYRQAMGQPPIPGTAYQPLPPGTPGLPGTNGGSVPGQGGAVPGQGYVIAPPAPPPAPATPATPAAGGGPATPATPAGQATPPVAPGQGGLSTISYNAATYHNLPLMRYLRGELSPGQFNTIASQPIEVPALGLTGDKALPAISALNYGKLLNLKKTDPEGYALLDSMYRAANVGSIDSILAYHQSIAPLGTAFESTLIET